MSQSNEFKAALSSAGFTGDLIIPGDSEYESAIARFAKNAKRNAGLVAFVKSAEDVSKVIKFANSGSSAQIPVVIRGGGHSPSGCSSTEGGIVIDLSRYLNTVRVDAEKKLAYAGGGAVWGTVDKESIQHGLATPSGGFHLTGVGGLCLGGGHGPRVGEHGLCADNVVGATLVTADGSILTLNASTNSDLFWAIRGAGCNFGCVTEFVLQLHDQSPHVYAGFLIYPPPMLPALVNALQDWYATASEKESAGMAMTNKGPTGDPVIAVIVFYNGDEETGRQKFAKLIELGPVMNGTGMIPYEVVGTLQEAMLPHGDNYSLTGTLRGEGRVQPEAVQDIFNQMVEITSATGPCVTDAGPIVSIIWEFSNLKKVSSVSPDATAYRMRVESPSLAILIRWQGDSTEANKDARDRLMRVRGAVDQNLKHTFPNGLGENDTGYGNYEGRDPSSTDSAIALFGGNYPRLQQLKKKYDPNMLFRSWYPIQPAA